MSALTHQHSTRTGEQSPEARTDPHLGSKEQQATIGEAGRSSIGRDQLLSRFGRDAERLADDDRLSTEEIKNIVHRAGCCAADLIYAVASCPPVNSTPKDNPFRSIEQGAKGTSAQAASSEWANSRLQNNLFRAIDQLPKSESEQLLSRLAGSTLPNSAIAVRAVERLADGIDTEVYSTPKEALFRSLALRSTLATEVRAAAFMKLRQFDFPDESSLRALERGLSDTALPLTVRCKIAETIADNALSGRVEIPENLQAIRGLSEELLKLTQTGVFATSRSVDGSYSDKAKMRAVTEALSYIATPEDGQLLLKLCSASADGGPDALVWGATALKVAEKRGIITACEIQQLTERAAASQKLAREHFVAIAELERLASGSSGAYRHAERIITAPDSPEALRLEAVKSLISASFLSDSPSEVAKPDLVHQYISKQLERECWSDDELRQVLYLVMDAPRLEYTPRIHELAERGEITESEMVSALAACTASAPQPIRDNLAMAFSTLAITSSSEDTRSNALQALRLLKSTNLSPEFIAAATAEPSASDAVKLKLDEKLQLLAALNHPAAERALLRNFASDIIGLDGEVIRYLSAHPSREASAILRRHLDTEKYLVGESVTALAKIDLDAVREIARAGKPNEPTEKYGQALLELFKRGEPLAVRELLKVKIDPDPFGREEPRSTIENVIKDGSAASWRSILELMKSDNAYDFATAVRRGLMDVYGEPEKRRELVAELRETAAEKGVDRRTRRSLLGWAADLEAAEKLDIQNPFRYSPDFLHTIVTNRAKGPDLQRGESRLAVVVVSREDDSNALSALAALAQLKQNGYRVMLYEADTDFEANRAANSSRWSLESAVKDGTTRRGSRVMEADLHLFVGHGSRTMLALGEGDPRFGSTGGPGTLDVNDSRMFAAAGISSRLKAGGQVMTISCINGAGRDEPRSDPNLVRFLRNQYPHAGEKQVIGAESATTFDGFIFDNTGKVLQPKYSVPPYQAAVERESAVEAFPA